MAQFSSRNIPSNDQWFEFRFAILFLLIHQKSHQQHRLYQSCRCSQQGSISRTSIVYSIYCLATWSTTTCSFGTISVFLLSLSLNSTFFRSNFQFLPRESRSLIFWNNIDKINKWNGAAFLCICFEFIL